MRRQTILPLLLVLGLLAACGGDDDPQTASEEAVEEVMDDAADAAEDAAAGDEDAAEDAVEAAEELADDAQEMADEMAEDLEEQQEAVGGGGATVTIDGETWEFDSILCAFGEEEIGQEGAELVVSATADGLQFYVSIDSFGESIDLNDIEDFENPSVAWSAFEMGPDEVEINVDGKDVSGSSDAFRSEITDGLASGSFEATCP